MKYSKKEAYRLLENDCSLGTDEFTKIIDMSDFKYPLIKKVNYSTGAFKDIYLKFKEEILCSVIEIKHFVLLTLAENLVFALLP